MAFKKIIMLLVVFSILVKLVFLFGSGAYHNPQTFEYEEMAQNMLDGKGLYYSNLGIKYYGGIGPGFPLMCYGVYKLFGHNPLYIIFIQIVVTSLLIIPVALIARRIFDEKTAVLAGFLVGLHPALIVYAACKVHKMNIYSFLFILLAYLFLRLKEDPRLSRFIILGIVAGITMLVRVTGVVFIFFGLIWFYWVSRERAGYKIKAIALFLLIFFLTLIPWQIRNYAVFGKPVLLRTNQWGALWYGNIPGSKGCLYGEDGSVNVDNITATLPPEFFKMDEIKQNDYLKALTIGYFREDPGAFITRIIKKVYYFWYFSPYQGSLYPKLWMRLYKIYYLFILTPAIFSIIYSFLFLKKGNKQEMALILALFLGLTMVHSLYFVEARHRWTIEPLLLIFTANGLLVIRSFIFKPAKLT